MIRIGLPVPPGFTITTAACNEFYKLDQNYPVELKDQVSEAIKKVETKINKVFGDENDPLLVSVRSGGKSFYARDDGYCFKFGFK